MEKRINAVTARQKFGQMLEETFYRGDTFIIERAGKPMAAVVPIELYQQWHKEREAFFGMIDEVQNHTRKIPASELGEVIKEAAEAAKGNERPAGA